PRPVVRRADRGVRPGDEAVRDRRRPAARRGDGRAGGNLQSGNHAGTSLRCPSRPRGAAAVDRSLARITRKELPMRAREPDRQEFVNRDGVRIGYEVFGEGPETVLFLPTWSIVHSRVWKAQVPYLARHMRVVTFDGRGNGRSARPTEAPAYETRAFAAHALAVLDAAGVEQAWVVSISKGATWAVLLAAEHPERVRGTVFIAPSMPLAPGHKRDVDFNKVHADNEGWHRYNRHSWLADHRGF